MTLLHASLLSATVAMAFATLDWRAYSPLCLLLGTSYGAVVLQGMAR